MNNPAVVDSRKLHRSLTNQPPRDEETVKAFERIREVAKVLGDQILRDCPIGRERSIAVTKLEETVMWAVKAIAVNQDGSGG